MMIQRSTIIALLLFHFVYAKEQTKEECGGQVASGSPFDSCGRLTLSGSEKCIPRNKKFSCEDVLKSVPEYLGFLTNVVARIMLCTCTKYEPWPSINAADHYTVTEIFKSDGGRLEGPTIVGSDLYWTGIADGIFKWSGRFSDDGGEITKIVDGSKDFGAHGMTFDNSTQTLVVTSVSQGCIYCPGVFRVDLSGENMKKISDGTPLHWPNDVTVRSSDGVIYFTDPMFAPPRSRYHGLYSIRSNGDVVLEFDFKDIYRGIGLTSGPNGLNLIEDESVLIVNMMGLHEYTRFSVNDDGSLEYLGKFGDGGLDIIYNADGNAIFNNTMYVASGKDFILRIPLNEEGDFEGEITFIDTFDVGMYKITNLDINQTDGTIYATEMWNDGADKIFMLEPF